MHIFPSTTHLLPGGRAKLIISEEKSQRSLRQILDTDTSFVLCMQDKMPADALTLSVIGTVVEPLGSIDQTAAGLELELHGCYKVELLALERQDNNLLFSEVRRAANWSPIALERDSDILATKLADLIESVPSLVEHYPAPQLDDLSWVAQRWIEVLPLETVHKRMLISQPTPALAERFLKKLLVTENWI